jgi:hypothetical protein
MLDPVMYNATVRALPFAQQCLAASFAGCGALDSLGADEIAARSAAAMTSVLS